MPVRFVQLTTGFIINEEIRVLKPPRHTKRNPFKELPPTIVWRGVSDADSDLTLSPDDYLAVKDAIDQYMGVL